MQPFRFDAMQKPDSVLQPFVSTVQQKLAARSKGATKNSPAWFTPAPGEPNQGSFFSISPGAGLMIEASISPTVNFGSSSLKQVRWHRFLKLLHAILGCVRFAQHLAHAHSCSAKSQRFAFPKRMGVLLMPDASRSCLS